MKIDRRKVVAASVAAFALAGASLPASTAGAATTSTLVAAGSSWRYADGGADLGTAWRVPGYTDTAWKQGSAELGYGDGDEATTVTGKRSTYYFRRTFSVSDASTVTSLNLRAVVDDGAVAYLNGTEIWRKNVAAGQTYQTLAQAYVAGAAEKAWTSASVSRSPLVSGTNVLAVEVHNDALSSSDISFNFELTQTSATAGTAATPATPGPQTMCRIDNASLREISGLAASVNFPGVLWTHNDSGDSARIFAVDAATCAVRATVTLAGVSAQDFESISVGRDASGRAEIWVGDTGDNGKARANVKLHRFAEPTSLVNQSVAVKTVTVTWSDGKRDCEGMIVEPVANGRVFLVSKEATGGMYQLRGDFRSTGTATTGTRVMNVRGYVTDAATAPDRSRTVLRSGNYGTIMTGLPGSAARSFTYPAQAQGEAVTFSVDGRYLYIASEGATDLIRIPVASI